MLPECPQLLVVVQDRGWQAGLFAAAPPLVDKLFPQEPAERWLMRPDPVIYVTSPATITSVT